MPLDVALARLRHLGVRYLMVPDSLNGAPRERVVIAEFPGAARGDGWTLRAL